MKEDACITFAKLNHEYFPSWIVKCFVVYYFAVFLHTADYQPNFIQTMICQQWLAINSHNMSLIVKCAFEISRDIFMARTFYQRYNADENYIIYYCIKGIFDSPKFVCIWSDVLTIWLLRMLILYNFDGCSNWCVIKGKWLLKHETHETKALEDPLTYIHDLKIWSQMRTCKYVLYSYSFRKLWNQMVGSYLSYQIICFKMILLSCTSDGILSRPGDKCYEGA